MEENSEEKEINSSQGNRIPVIHRDLGIVVHVVQGSRAAQQYQEDHRLQAHNVVLEALSRSLCCLDGLGVFESEVEVDGDVGEDQHE